MSSLAHRPPLLPSTCQGTDYKLGRVFSLIFAHLFPVGAYFPRFTYIIRYFYSYIHLFSISSRKSVYVLDEYFRLFVCMLYVFC